MLPLSSRLLARYEARDDFTKFLKWTRAQITKNQSKRSRLWPRNPQGGRPYKPKKEGLQPFHGKPWNAKPREKRVQKTVPASIRSDAALAPAISGWQGEGWKTDGWGQDKLKPPPSDRDLSPKFKKSTSSELISEALKTLGPARPSRRTREIDIEFTRRLEGVLTPLGSPVLQDVRPLTEHRQIATLAHKLDRVLFNPGVHWLQDPRSGIYNFNPWLQDIPDVSDFAFERLPEFVKSSRDKELRELTKQEGKIFSGSTSSLTGMLSQVYFLISGLRMPDTSALSLPFNNLPRDFTAGQRMPASVLLNHKDGVYAIDPGSGEKDDPEKIVLPWLGTLLEKFLTMPPEEFRRLLRSSPNPASGDTETREAYRYAKSRKFVMRSQLDCYDPRLPGTGVFDLKTRAVLPVRMDILNYQQHSTYLIRTAQGELESFEREYHDLIRSAFLKYGFQARIGNMDGVLVAHHNTSKMFGFRYIPLSEMDACLFGSEDRGESVFEKCVLLLEEILMEAISVFPDQNIRCLFETLDDKLDVYIQPDVHDESKGPRPIVHIVVGTTSYIDGRRTDGEEAVVSSGAWDLRWSITHPSSSQGKKEYKLNKAKARQLRAYSLPPGVSLDGMEEIWNQLDFSGKQRLLEKTPAAPLLPSCSVEEKKSTFDPSFFMPPTDNVRFLREVSERGKVDMELMLEKTKGRPKVVWGEPEAYVDQVESGWSPTESEMVEASVEGGGSLVKGGDAAPVDEDVKASDAAASATDYGQVVEDKE